MPAPAAEGLLQPPPPRGEPGGGGEIIIPYIQHDSVYEGNLRWSYYYFAGTERQ